MSETPEYVPQADAETMLTVLNTMDNGVFDMLLQRYGGSGTSVGNRYRYAIAGWYLASISANPSYYAAHNQITTAQEDQTGNVIMTCECGDQQKVGAGAVSRFGTPEWTVFHQIDYFWQNFAPKDRPQWYEYQG